MEHKALNLILASFAYIAALSLSSCDSHSSKKAISDSVNTSFNPNDTARPPEPPLAAASSTDFITPEARQADTDSVGEKIIVHKDKLKVVDTAKNEK